LLEIRRLISSLRSVTFFLLVDDLARAGDDAAGRDVAGGSEEWYLGFRVWGLTDVRS
jgi:hypothetical protein